MMHNFTGSPGATELPGAAFVAGTELALPPALVEQAAEKRIVPRRANVNKRFLMVISLPKSGGPASAARTCGNSGLT